MLTKTETKNINLTYRVSNGPNGLDKNGNRKQAPRTTTMSLSIPQPLTENDIVGAWEEFSKQLKLALGYQEGMTITPSEFAEFLFNGND